MFAAALPPWFWLQLVALGCPRITSGAVLLEVGIVFQIKTLCFELSATTRAVPLLPIALGAYMEFAAQAPEPTVVVFTVPREMLAGWLVPVMLDKELYLFTRLLFSSPMKSMSENRERP